MFTCAVGREMDSVPVLRKHGFESDERWRTVTYKDEISLRLPYALSGLQRYAGWTAQRGAALLIATSAL
jgi:hypothetical protein